MFPTKDILEATYRIRVKNSIGTAFCVFKNEKLYFVTAKHMFVDMNSNENSCIVDDFVICNSCLEGHFRNIPVFFGKAGIDVAILCISLNDSLRSISYSKLTQVGMCLGESVLMLGFPFVFNFGHKLKNPDSMFYLPIVKSGVVSVFGGDKLTFLIDAHNNGGFSGGPVIMKTGNQGCCVCGIVSGFYPDIYDKQPDGIVNSGFTIVYPIGCVTELIDMLDENQRTC